MTSTDEPVSPAPALLFVYGTLRPRCASDMTRRLVDDLEHAGEATMRGTLYDIGPYPAMRRGEGTVRGDLLAVRDAARLRALDAYEECGGPSPLFERVTAVARRTDGVEVVAWVYLYVGPLGTARPIDGGDYATVVRPARHG